MKQLGRAILRSQKGLTLLELTVVAAILSVLAGITAAAVTGSTGHSKEILLQVNVSEIQKASDRFNGEHPFSLYPTVNGCLPGETKDSATHRCDAGATVPADFTATDRTTWEAIIWEKAFATQSGTTVFVDDLLANVPARGDEHGDGTAWSRLVNDPDGIVTSILAPDNHGAQDSPVDANARPIYVLDKKGDVQVIPPLKGF